MGKRIDSLEPNTEVLLHFTGEGDSHEPAKFLRIEGEGDAREAFFETDDKDGEPFEWAAYRYKGRWAYGTSAETLRLVGVKE